MDWINRILGHIDKNKTLSSNVASPNLGNLVVRVEEQMQHLDYKLVELQTNMNGEGLSFSAVNDHNIQVGSKHSSVKL